MKSGGKGNVRPNERQVVMAYWAASVPDGSHNARNVCPAPCAVRAGRLVCRPKAAGPAS